MADGASALLEKDGDGDVVGRSPLQCTRQELAAEGHAPISAQEALRLHCLDCCANNAAEVRKCVAVRCVSWPFRLGRSPWKAAPVISEETRQKRIAGLAKAREAKEGKR